MNRLEQIRVAALEALELRRRTKPTPIDNSTLVAGSRMYFYCRTCGALSDVKPENYLFPPDTHCSECRGLIDHGWLSRGHDHNGECLDCDEPYGSCGPGCACRCAEENP